MKGAQTKLEMEESALGTEQSKLQNPAVMMDAPIKSRREASAKDMGPSNQLAVMMAAPIKSRREASA